MDSEGHRCLAGRDSIFLAAAAADTTGTTGTASGSPDRSDPTAGVTLIGEPISAENEIPLTTFTRSLSRLGVRAVKRWSV